MEDSDKPGEWELRREIEQTALELDRSRIEFLSTDLDVTLTMTQVASAAASGSEKRERNVRNARHAYDVITHLRESVDAGPEINRELDEKLHQLRAALTALGEKF